jgi:hypothetical protein
MNGTHRSSFFDRFLRCLDSGDRYFYLCRRLKTGRLGGGDPRSFCHFRRRVLRSFLGGRPILRCVSRSVLTRNPPPDLQGHVVVQRAGMCFFVANTEFWQQIKNYVGFHFQLTRQLVNANLTHRGRTLMLSTPAPGFKTICLSLIRNLRPPDVLRSLS